MGFAGLLRREKKNEREIPAFARKPNREKVKHEWTSSTCPRDTIKSRRRAGFQHKEERA